MNNDDLLLICGGTNDINEFCDVNSLYHEVQNNIKNCLHTNIIISAIPFRYDTPSLNKKIHLMNLKLKQLSIIQTNVHFLPLNFIEQSDYSKIGIHLNFFGKNQFSNRIMDFVNNKESNKCYFRQVIPVIITKRDHLVNNKFRKYNRNSLRLAKPSNIQYWNNNNDFLDYSMTHQILF